MDDFPVSEKWELYGSVAGYCAPSSELLKYQYPTYLPDSVQDAPVAVDLECEIGAGDRGRPVAAAVVVDLGDPELVDVVESVEVPFRNVGNFKMLFGSKLRAKFCEFSHLSLPPLPGLSL